MSKEFNTPKDDVEDSIIARPGEIHMNEDEIQAAINHDENSIPSEMQDNRDSLTGMEEHQSQSMAPINVS